MDPELLKLATLAAAVGGTLSVGALLPQVWRIVQRRSAADVSLAMYMIVVVASALWIFYGYVHESTEIMVPNAAIAAIAAFIIALKFRYGGK